jgi:hypothetical protein
VVIAHISGVPVEALLALASGGGAIWAAARAWTSMRAPTARNAVAILRARGRRDHESAAWPPLCDAQAAGPRRSARAARDASNRMDEVVQEALIAIQGRELERLKPLSHPYLHWRRGGGAMPRGRSRVMAWLAEAPPPRAPQSYGLRDAQTYRWHERP